MQNVAHQHGTLEIVRQWNTQRAKVAVVFLFSLCWLVSCLSRAYTQGDFTGVDPSWVMGLASSFQQGLVSGRDIHFTYGPLAQLLAWFATTLTTSKSAFDGYRMICFVFLSLSPLILAAVFLLLPQVSSLQTALIYIFLLSLNTFGENASFRAALLILAAVLPFRILAAPRSRQTMYVAALAVFCFACQLITLDIGVYSASVALGMLVIADFRRLTKTWYTPAIFVAVFAGLNLSADLFFKVTSASYRGLFDYQRYAIETIRGYNNTMGVDWELNRFKTFILISIVVYAIVFAVRAIRRTTALDRYSIAGLLGVALLSLKSAMVRSDAGHIALAAGPVVFFFLLLANARWNTKWGLYVWCPLALSLFWLEPMAGLSVPREIWKAATFTPSVVAILKDISSVPVPVDVVLPQSVLQSVSRTDRRPLLSFPYDDYLAIALKRPLVAPVLQSYGALTPSLQDFYVDSLRRLPTAPQVIYAVDEIAAWPIDGVQTITRVPKIFEYLDRNFDLAGGGETSDGYYFLEPRRTPRTFVLAPLSSRKESSSATSGLVRLDMPTSCGLVQLEMTIRTSVRSLLFRPTGVQLTFRRGEGIIRTATVRPLQFNVPFTTYVSLLDAQEFYRFFEDGPAPFQSWNVIKYERSRVDRISARPTFIDISVVRCVNPQMFVEVATSDTMTQAGPLSSVESGPLSMGYAVLLPTVGQAPRWTAQLIRGEGGVRLSRDVQVARPATRHRMLLQPVPGNSVGIAMANPHAEPLILEIERQSGTNVQKAVLRLGAKEHAARLLSELFPANHGNLQDSSISVTSAKSVALLVTRFSGAQFQILDDVAEEDRKANLVFPQFVNGAGWATAFVLANSSDSLSEGRLQFFANNGKPMTVKINGVEASEFPYSIAPGQEARFEP